MTTKELNLLIMLAEIILQDKNYDESCHNLIVALNEIKSEAGER